MRALCVSFAVAVVVVCAKFWTLGDAACNALGGAVILYMLTMLWHALNNHEAVRSAINLRFENERLIGELKTQSDNARTAQLGSLSGILCARHSMTKRSMYA